MSKSVGIVAEYNPFHTGHRYQLDFLREKGCENIVIAMSGSCVQRGELAVFDKFTRRETALLNGADMVVEIPRPFSIRSAEGYRTAGMQTLKAVGVDAVSFGSESGGIDMLYKIAFYLLSEEYETNLKNYLGENLSFASAREKAIFDRFDINKDVVSASNDILAIEYIKACIKMDWHPEFIPVKRTGAGYNSNSENEKYASASGIRNMIKEYRTETARKFIPADSNHIVNRNLDRGSYFIADTAFEKAVLFSLQNKTADYFISLPDCNSELANSFEKAFSTAYSMESLYDNLPTKRYTKSRMNRIILSALMGISKDMPADIQYIRLLGFNKKREGFVKQRSKNCPLPFSHSVKILARKNEECELIAQAESRCCDRQAIFCKISQSPRKDYTSKIIKI